MTDHLVAGSCWACVVGLHDECFAPVVDGEVAFMSCCCVTNPDAEVQSFGLVGRPVLGPSDITDVTSTGRKRAAMMYPILDGMLCEWAGLKHAGGGVEPIVGCSGNTISDTKTGPHAGHRHHGPDKNTIANDPLNVHRICTRCHNRYHALNNKYYPGTRPPTDQQWLPVAPEGMVVHKHDFQTQASDEDREESNAWWAMSKADRGVVLDD